MSSVCTPPQADQAFLHQRHTKPRSTPEWQYGSDENVENVRRKQNVHSVRKYRKKKKLERLEMEQVYKFNEERIRALEAVEAQLTEELLGGRRAPRDTMKFSKN